MNNTNPLLDHVSKFVSLSEEEIEFVFQNIRKQSYQKKDFLLRSGSISRHFFFVVTGCLKKYYVNSEGKDRVFEFAVEDNWIGDLKSLKSNSSSIFNILALEDSVVYQISQSQMNELLNHVPPFERYFRLINEEKIHKQEIRIKQSLSCSAEERYSDFQMDYKGLELRIAQKEVASYLGVSRETLSRLDS